MTDSSPDQSAQQDKGWWWAGELSLGFIVSIKLEPGLELNSNHTHYLYSNVFCNEKLFFLYEEKKENTIILLPAVFCPDV